MNAITLIWRQVLKELKLFQMKKNKEDDGIYRKPTKGFSKRTNMIVGIAFVIFVLVCCIIRLFV